VTRLPHHRDGSIKFSLIVNSLAVDFPCPGMENPDWLFKGPAMAGSFLIGPCYSIFATSFYFESSLFVQCFDFCKKLIVSLSIEFIELIYL